MMVPLASHICSRTLLPAPRTCAVYPRSRKLPSAANPVFCSLGSFAQIAPGSGGRVTQEESMMLRSVLHFRSLPQLLHASSHGSPGRLSWVHGRHGGWPKGLCRLVVSRAASGQELATAATGLSLDSVLQNVRNAMGIDLPITEEVVVRGTGTHLGIDVGWQVCMRPDGAFVEEIAGCQLSFRWGHDGGRYSGCWEVDDAGVSKRLELDDNEAMLISAWVRSCYWLHPGLSDRLEVTLLPNSAVLLNGSSARETNSKASAGVDEVASDGSEEPFVTLGLKFLDGKAKAGLRVSTNNWQPLQLIQPMCGDTETWTYLSWQQHCGGLTYPTEVLHLGAAGGQHVYLTYSASLRRQTNWAFSYSMPEVVMKPADTQFLPGISPTVTAWRSQSGHVLVQPKVNGREVGYMILDTGASGFVMEKAAADELGLESFGQLHVSGMAGKVHSQFRRADSVQIGPLLMKRPLFMEMMLGGIVRGAPGPVVGIVGYDIFRRSVIELPVQKALSGEYDILMHDPEHYQPGTGLEGRWETIRMVANLPHVKAEFKQRNKSATQSGLFMLDSGAGGVDAMFHVRACKEYDLIDNKSNNFRFIKGVGGEEMTSIRVQSGELHWMELSSNRLERIRSLFGGRGGLDLSQYTCGLICADLMGRMHVIVDYPRCRIAFLDQKSSSKNGTSA